MIGLVLAAQIAAAQPLPILPLGHVDHFIIQRPRSAASCPLSGRMEASFEPAALYRRGDRDPHVLRRWVDFPDGKYCLAGGAP